MRVCTHLASSIMYPFVSLGFYVRITLPSNKKKICTYSSEKEMEIISPSTIATNLKKTRYSPSLFVSAYIQSYKLYDYNRIDYKSSSKLDQNLPLRIKEWSCIKQIVASWFLDLRNEHIVFFFSDRETERETEGERERESERYKYSERNYI